jgi:hypothetical protein
MKKLLGILDHGSGFFIMKAFIDWHKKYYKGGFSGATLETGDFFYTYSSSADPNDAKAWKYLILEKKIVVTVWAACCLDKL